MQNEGMKRSSSQLLLIGNGRRELAVAAAGENTMLIFYLPIIIFEAMLYIRSYAVSPEAGN